MFLHLDLIALCVWTVRCVNLVKLDSEVLLQTPVDVLSDPEGQCMLMDSM